MNEDHIDYTCSELAEIDPNQNYMTNSTASPCSYKITSPYFMQILESSHTIGSFNIFVYSLNHTFGVFAISES